MRDFVIDQARQSIAVKQALLRDDDAISAITKVAGAAVDIFKRGHRLLVAGNGGSAADAQHVAGELVNRLYFDRPALPAIALTTDTSVITSIGNDSGFDLVYSRQIEALGETGDMFIGISTSGNAINILNALNACRKKNILPAGLTGRSGGKMEGFCDICIKVPSDETPRIQESHGLICHILCALIEEALFGK